LPLNGGTAVSDRSSPALEFRAVSFSYGSDSLIDDLDFAVGAGEFLGLVGPNGSGKTTIVKLASRVLRSRSGRVLVGGEDIGRLRPRDLACRIAVVPQESGVSFPYRVAEIVLMGRAPYHGLLAFDGEEDLAVAREVMALTDTERLADRYFFELSGGEKQMVVIARALAQEPEILLLDEPTAFLDIRHQIEIYELIRRLNREQGITVVSVMHDLNLAGLYCERLLLLKQGRVVRTGRPGDVLTPATVRDVFEADVHIETHPATGKVTVLPLSRMR